MSGSTRQNIRGECVDAQAWETVKDILKRGNDALIKKKGDGYIVLEVKKTTKYSTAD